MEHTVGFYLERQRDKNRLNNEELLSKMKLVGGDEKLKIQDLLIKNNAALINDLIRKCFGDVGENCMAYRITYDDLFSIGVTGLTNAIRTFNVDKGCKFTTLAYRCVWSELAKYKRDNKKNYGTSSIDEPIATDSHGDSQYLSDIIPDDTSNVEDYIESQHMGLFMEKLKSSLTKRESIILDFLFYKDLKQTDLCRELNLSKPHVSRECKKFIEKARKMYFELENIGQVVS